jgi:biotin operon repressor
MVKSFIIHIMKMKMWTMKEKELLKKHYKQVSMEELLTLLPGRTENSIYKQVNYLRKKGWIIRKRTDHGN